jgi:hypothetical protein
MLTQCDAAFVFGRCGDIEGPKDSDEGVVPYDDLSTVGVLVVSSNAIAGGQLRQ